MYMYPYADDGIKSQWLLVLHSTYVSLNNANARVCGEHFTHNDGYQYSGFGAISTVDLGLSVQWVWGYQYSGFGATSTVDLGLSVQWIWGYQYSAFGLSVQWVWATSTVDLGLSVQWIWAFKGNAEARCRSINQIQFM